MSHGSDDPAAKPRIMVDVRKIEDSGIGTYIRNIVPRVVRRLPNCRFLLLGSRDRIAHRMSGADNHAIVECGVRPLSTREQLQLPRYIPRRIDVFWATHFNIPLVYSGRLVATIHDIMPMATPELSGGRLHGLYTRVMTAALRYKRARIISVSDFTASELARLARIPRDCVTTIHEAADASWSRVAPRSNPRPRPYLLTVGLVKPHKNLIALLKAFDLLRERWPHDLVIVGDRDRIVTRDTECERFALRFGDRVVFTGRVSDVEIEQYFAHADALVLPSLYEGFGLPAVEAMACGCPVVASRAASLPEVCGDAAQQFDPRNPADIAAAVSRCIGSPDERARMIEAGRRQAARFSWDRAADETAALLAEMCGLTGNREEPRL
jgi:glycosyltransferase involved in cell wall biosynthesis